jgi:hypothetical protein
MSSCNLPCLDRSRGRPTIVPAQKYESELSCAARSELQPSGCSTSGAWGLMSSVSSLLDERSAAFERRPAATSASVVAFANFRSVAAWSARYFFPTTIVPVTLNPMSKTLSGGVSSRNCTKMYTAIRSPAGRLRTPMESSRLRLRLFDQAPCPPILRVVVKSRPDPAIPLDLRVWLLALFAHALVQLSMQLVQL